MNVTIIDPTIENDELHFKIQGDQKYGLDKSYMNAFRRILLNDIPTVAFRTDDKTIQKDITIVINNTSLHNEMLLNRISLLPLYIDPEKYLKNHFFECKVKHTSKSPFQFITANDIDILPLNDGFKSRMQDLYDESVETSEIEEANLKGLLESHDIQNYSQKKLSQKEKDEIFRPFEFRNKKHYCMINELKNTNSDDTYQELHFYGSPSIGTTNDHACFQAVSCASYSFSIDEELFQSVIQEKLKLQNIEEKDRETFEKKLTLSESERYYYRDNDNEPYMYDFRIKSAHFYDSETLFKKSILILIDQLKDLRLAFLYLLQEKDSSIDVQQKNDYLYHYEIQNCNHTLGNLLQSHIVRRSIDDKSILQSCGYKRPHPLEESILLIVSLNHKHTIMKDIETHKFQKITQFLMDQIDEILQGVYHIQSVAEKSL